MRLTWPLWLALRRCHVEPPAPLPTRPADRTRRLSRVSTLRITASPAVWAGMSRRPARNASLVLLLLLYRPPHAVPTISLTTEPTADHPIRTRIPIANRR